jgi:predicted Zn finger-like uncharacterized protein
MRLTCPNCGAQYAVDPAVIPAEGRDVQCSSCGHTWFQLHPDTAVKEAEPPFEEALARRAPDPAALDILREEAERERAQRAAERAPLESQPELAFAAPDGAAEPPPPFARPAEPAPPPFAGPAEPAPPPEPDGPREGAAALAPDPDTAGALSDAERAVRPAPRRSRLPDIEEINSSFAGIGQDDAPGPVARAARRERERQGMRLGFGLAVGFFAALALLYIQGPRIAAALPAFGPALESYVGAIDSGRLWLDGALRAAVAPLDDQSGGEAES